MSNEKQLQVEYVLVDDLKFYERNSRTHSEEQIAQLGESIKEFGFTNPVLIDEDNVLIAGHGRTTAAKLLGLKEVPAIRLVGLSEAQRKALRIADNKLALEAGWDEEILASELAELQELGFDLELTGFDLDEIEEFLDFPIYDETEKRFEDTEHGQQVVKNTSQELNPDDYSDEHFAHTCPRCGFTFNDKRGDGM